MNIKAALQRIAIAGLALVVFIPVTRAQDAEERPNQVFEWNEAIANYVNQNFLQRRQSSTTTPTKAANGKER